MSQDCNGNEYCGSSSDGGFIDLTQAGIGVANSGVWPYLHDRVQGQAQQQPTTESSSINWAILAPAIVGAVLAIVLFIAVAIYVKRNKVTSRSSSSAEPQLEGVTVETAATSSPVVESATAEGQTASPETITPETIARVPVVTLGETRA